MTCLRLCRWQVWDLNSAVCLQVLFSVVSMKCLSMSGYAIRDRTRVPPNTWSIAKKKECMTQLGRSEFKSQLAVCPWENVLPTLSFTFPICQIEKSVLPPEPAVLHHYVTVPQYVPVSGRSNVIFY